MNYQKHQQQHLAHVARLGYVLTLTRTDTTNTHMLFAGSFAM
jgi:hypothetical protein